MEMHTYKTIGHQQHYGKTKSSKTESRIDSEAVYEPPSIATQPVTNEYQKPNLQLTSDKHDTVAIAIDRNPNRKNINYSDYGAAHDYFCNRDVCFTMHVTLHFCNCSIRYTPST